MEFHMINIIYAALPMRAQTEKTTFSRKDDYTLKKHTWGWTYSGLQYLFYVYSVSLGDALTTAAVRPFLYNLEVKRQKLGLLFSHVHCDFLGVFVLHTAQWLVIHLKGLAMKIHFVAFNSCQQPQ